MSEVTKEELAATNQLHLQWLESNTRPDLQIVGIDVLKAYTYDFIQLMNNTWLKERLA